jgi:phosphate transport system protein
MPRLIDLALEKLTNMILDMANLSEKAIFDALKIYRNTPEKPTLSYDHVFQISEQLRILREETSGLATEILARYQPLAGDLRFINSCLDIAYDLARFGRYAYDIALTPYWLGNVEECNLEVPMLMADKALVMIKKSMDAFKTRDATLAKTLPENDDEIDAMYKSTILSLLDDDDISNKCALVTTLLVRHIERIADHACYIADAVVYIVDGEKLGLH